MTPEPPGPEWVGGGPHIGLFWWDKRGLEGEGGRTW
jgi:hypothetical protein